MRYLFWFLILFYSGSQLSACLASGGFYSGRHFDTVDFANYWIAAKIYFEGAVSDIFDPRLFTEHLRSAFRPDYPGHGWSYPPHFLLFCLPLYAFGFHAAFAAFTAVTFAFFALSAVLFANAYLPPEAGHKPAWRDGLFVTLVAAASIVNLSVAQNGFLVSGLMLAGLALMRRHGIAAGICFGLLTVKPHLGVLVPVLLVIDRNLSAFLAATLTTLVLVAVSALVFGAGSWVAYLTDTAEFQMRVLTDIERADIYPLMMLSAFVGARLSGLGVTASWIVHAAVALPALALAVWTYARGTDPVVRIAAAVAATFLVSPYSFNYDGCALAVACALLAVADRQRMREAAKAGDPAGRLLAAGRFRLACAAASLPLTSFFAMQAHVPIAPAILLALLAACSPLGPLAARRWAAERPDPRLPESRRAALTS